MFDYTGWLIAGIIDGYKTGERSFSRTTKITDDYLEAGKITQAQAIEIAIACPKPSYEPEQEEVTETETVIEDETVVEEETEVTGTTETEVIEEETPIIEETTEE